MLLPFALSIVFALVASLIVAVTVVPMMSYKMMAKKKDVRIIHEDKGAGKFTKGYKHILNWSLNHKAVTFGGAVVLFVGSLLLLLLSGLVFYLIR